jgi:hypothetical protein
MIRMKHSARRLLLCIPVASLMWAAAFGAEPEPQEESPPPSPPPPTVTAPADEVYGFGLTGTQPLCMTVSITG